MTFAASFFSLFFLAAGAYAGSLLFFLLKCGRTAWALLICGFICHSASLLARGWHFGTFLPLNMMSEQYLLPWFLAAAIVVLSRTPGSRNGAPSLLPPLCVLMALGMFLPASAIPPAPQTATVFAPLFFSSEVMAHAMFLAGGWLAAGHLCNRTSVTPFNPWATWGFIIFSLAQVAGAAWSWLGWSLPFHWSERHLLSAALWCFYCAYLHLHFSQRWSVRGKAWFAIAGAVLVFASSYYHSFVMLGVNHG